MSNNMIYLVGEAHPETLLFSSLSYASHHLPTEEWIDFIKSYSILVNPKNSKKYSREHSNSKRNLTFYFRTINKYFSEVRAKDGHYYRLDEQEFSRRDENQFWKEMEVAMNRIKNILPQGNSACNLISRSRKVLNRKRQLIRTHKPEVIYHEGSKKELDSMGLHILFKRVAEEIGSEIVYLDHGFGPYRKGLEKSEVQRGREEYWIKRILSRQSSGTAMAFVGSLHIKGEKNQESEWGRFPRLLEEAGLEHRVLEVMRP